MILSKLILKLHFLFCKMKIVTEIELITSRGSIRCFWRAYGNSCQVESAQYVHTDKRHLLTQKKIGKTVLNMLWAFQPPEYYFRMEILVLYVCHGAWDFHFLHVYRLYFADEWTASNLRELGFTVVFLSKSWIICLSVNVIIWFLADDEEELFTCNISAKLP